MERSKSIKMRIAAVFAASLLSFVEQRQHRGLLIAASAFSLVFFLAFVFGYSFFAYGLMDGWLVCAYDKMAFGVVPVIGYGVAAFARS